MKKEILIIKKEKKKENTHTHRMWNLTIEGQNDESEILPKEVEIQNKNKYIYFSSKWSHPIAPSIYPAKFMFPEKKTFGSFIYSRNILIIFYIRKC